MHVLTMHSTQSVSLGGVESDDSDNSEEDSSNTQEYEMGGIASLVGTSLFPLCLSFPPSCNVAQAQISCAHCTFCYYFETLYQSFLF
jgi:hypothetical protein